MANQYLYGASVQGIQSFIFQTSKLREIIGASELVESICTSLFKNNVESFDDNNLIVGAAGNIKYLFDSQENCQALVQIFPKLVAEHAPGITISQAVVVVSENTTLNKAIDELEINLKIQRNKPRHPFEIGFMGLARSRRTGGVGQTSEKGEIICEATSKKLDKSKSNQLFQKISGIAILDIKSERLAREINEISGSVKPWIAVIHADGNSVGSKIMELSAKLQDDRFKDAFRRFSRALQKSTELAAQAAFAHLAISDYPKYPLRPIILGGDDITIIIRADLALKYAVEYLTVFESETKIQLAFMKEEYGVDIFQNGMTACAGIAYVKKAYPLHYALDLANKLCQKAKNKSKDQMTTAPSALSFYKVQESFVDADIETLTNRTLVSKSINFDFGPYLLKQHTEYHTTVPVLLEKLDYLRTQEKSKEEGKAASKLRQLITELQKDNYSASFMIDRIGELQGNLHQQFQMGELKVQNGESAPKSIIYDVIQLLSFESLEQK
ncbi:MAG: CRISPR-associated protein [Saprospiraceae bacterium]